MSTRFFWRRPSIVVEDPTLVMIVRLPAVLAENLPFRRFWLGQTISRYVEANSLLAGSRAFSFVAGPSVGGILVQLLKAPFALVVDVVSFVFSALFLGSISPQEPPTEEAERGHVVAGARFVMRTPAIRSALLATATINLF